MLLKKTSPSIRLLRARFLLNNQFKCGYAITAKDSRFLKSFVRDKEHVNVAFIGDHGGGKTTLTSALSKHLSGIGSTQFKTIDEIDKSSEEKEKGHSINASKFEMETAKRHICLTDCPGKIDYFKSSFIGSSSCDVMILVVPADIGPTDTSRIHCLWPVANSSQLALFINKTDIVENDSIEFSELATREMLTELNFTGDLRVITGSALKALNGECKSIVALNDFIETFKLKERDSQSKPLFFVDKVFNPMGRSVGVTGILEKGQLTKGTEVEIIGLDKHVKTKANFLECFAKSIDPVIAGDSIEIVLQGVKKDDVSRGMALSTLGSLKVTDHVSAKVNFIQKHSAKKYPFLSKTVCQAHIRTIDISTEVELPENIEYVIGGENLTVNLRSFKPFVFEPGMGFVLRENERFIGIGKVTEIYKPLSLDEKVKIMKKSKAQREQHRARFEEISDKLNPL